MIDGGWWCCLIAIQAADAGYCRFLQKNGVFSRIVLKVKLREQHGGDPTDLKVKSVGVETLRHCSAMTLRGMLRPNTSALVSIQELSFAQVWCSEYDWCVRNSSYETAIFGKVCSRSIYK